MNTTTRYHHVDGILPFKPPPWSTACSTRVLTTLFAIISLFSIFVSTPARHNASSLSSPSTQLPATTTLTASFRLNHPPGAPPAPPASSPPSLRSFLCSPFLFPPLLAATLRLYLPPPLPRLPPPRTLSSSFSASSHRFFSPKIPSSIAFVLSSPPPMLLLSTRLLPCH